MSKVTCPGCNQERDPGHFYVYKSTGKKHKKCITCHRAYMKGWYAKHLAYRGQGETPNEAGHGEQPKDDGNGGVPNGESVPGDESKG